MAHLFPHSAPAVVNDSCQTPVKLMDHGAAFDNEARATPKRRTEVAERSLVTG